MGNPIDETISHPGATTLDECLRRAPSQIKPEELRHIITILIAERASFQVKAERRNAKREGLEEEEEEGTNLPSGEGSE